MTVSPKMALSPAAFCVEQMKVFDSRAYLGFVFAHDGLHMRGVQHSSVSCKVNVLLAVLGLGRRIDKIS